MQPLVSISIISYNQKAFIVEAIESAIQQDYANIQIVVADDGSTDGTDKILIDYAQRIPSKIVVLTGGPNLGVTGNSNRALKACRGKYIAFLGGDDVLLPGKISKQVAWLESDGTRVLCGHQVEVFYASVKKPRKFRRTMLFSGGRGASKMLRFGFPYAACAVMVRASVIPAHGFEVELPHISDYMMWAECLAAGGRYGHVSGTYSRYRRHSGNISNRDVELFHEMESTLRLFSSRYPAYKNDCTYAMGSPLQYAYGYASLRKRAYCQATSHFLSALRICPYHWKSWIRLIQVIFRKLVE